MWRIVHDGKRATGVVAVTPRGTLEIEAGAVVLAGSAIGSAVLARQSGLPDPYDRLGRGLRMHPGVAVAGLFDDRSRAGRAFPRATSARSCSTTPDSDKRVWITTVFAHPIGAGIMLPGFGPAHHEWMLRYPNIAVLTAMIHDETEGRVGVKDDGRALIDYTWSRVTSTSWPSASAPARASCSPPARRRC